MPKRDESPLPIYSLVFSEGHSRTVAIAVTDMEIKLHGFRPDTYRLVLAYFIVPFLVATEFYGNLAGQIRRSVFLADRSRRLSLRRYLEQGGKLPIGVNIYLPVDQHQQDFAEEEDVDNFLATFGELYPVQRA